jgi:NMD protein affecting ribosome stability and mRNA decay
MSDERKCPDCGAFLSVSWEQEYGPMIRKEEIAAMFEGTPEEFAKLPDELGRTVGARTETARCPRCPYLERNGQWVRRGNKRDEDERTG